MPFPGLYNTSTEHPNFNQLLQSQSICIYKSSHISNLKSQKIYSTPTYISYTCFQIINFSWILYNVPIHTPTCLKCISLYIYIYNTPTCSKISKRNNREEEKEKEDGVRSGLGVVFDASVSDSCILRWCYGGERSNVRWTVFDY